jgi:MtrB/PioB family decaheme-associated outer membrane protein
MAPVNHQLTDVDGGAEYQHGDLLVRGGYTGSWFHNDLTSITFDNPWRLVDSASASSRGRIALPPSNSLVGVNGLVSYRLPYKTRISAFASVGSLRDAGDALLPFTVNTALPVVALDRTTTEGQARTSAVNLTFTSRPSSVIDVDVRFRRYDYDNRTPEFTTLQRVAYDNAVSAVTNTALQTNEPFGVRRGTLDADVRYSPLRLISAGVGYSFSGEERTHRIFEQTNEHTLRVIADSVTNHWFTVRTKFEHAERRGEGDVSAIAAELGAIGEQAGMRHFDIASRNRNRVTVIGSAMPFASLAANVSIAAGKDDYLESLFGLRDNAHRVYGAGLDWSRDEDLGAGLSYTLERYTALSRSRQATSTAEFNDPSRNWATDSLDRARTWTGHADWRTLGRKLLVSLTGDVSLANGLYQYIAGPVPNRTLPEEAIVPSTLPDPKQLPPVRSELARGDLDVTYSLSSRWSVGTSVWMERYRVTDFTLDSDALSRIDLPGALLLGYQYLPYTAKTLWVRAIYRY